MSSFLQARKSGDFAWVASHEVLKGPLLAEKSRILRVALVYPLSTHAQRPLRNHFQFPKIRIEILKVNTFPFPFGSA